MFYFILGFGVGFYACYLALKIKKVKADKSNKVVSDNKKVDNETSKNVSENKNIDKGNK